MVGTMSWGFSEQGWRKGPWTTEEDKLLKEYVRLHGEGRWSSVASYTGLKRCSKSCRLRWVNYLRPDLKKGHLTPQEEGIIIELHALLGNKWSTIARYLPGRTDNEIKNYWRTHFKKQGKPSSLRQYKKKAQFVKQELLDNNVVMNNVSPQAGAQCLDEKRQGNQETVSPMYQNMGDLFLPVMSQDVSCWPETTVEDDFWGSLWNFLNS